MPTMPTASLSGNSYRSNRLPADRISALLTAAVGHLAGDRKCPEPVFGKGWLRRRATTWVTRDGDGWMADVPALPGTHTCAKTLMVQDLPRSAEAALDRPAMA